MSIRRSCVGLILTLIILSDYGAGSAAAMDIMGSGMWSPTIGASDLTAGAGSNLTGSYQSNSDQVLISISNTMGYDDNWRVDVRRSDTNWHSNFVLSVRRTGDGTGGGLIAGGGSYQSVGISDGAFFSGAGDRSDITIQLEISGVSIQIPPATYSTSIIFTVVDT